MAMDNRPWPALSFPALALVLLIIVELTGLNEPVFAWANDLSTLTGPRLWASVTILGDGLVCAVLLLPWIRRAPQRVLGGLLGALVAVSILWAFKGNLSLPRPALVLPEDAITIIGPRLRRRAFPSGHTLTAFLLAGALTLHHRKSWLPWVGGSLASVVGLSRLVVGAHWPADVLAGAALGWMGAWLGLRWAGRWKGGWGPTGRKVMGGLLLISALVLLVIDHTRYPNVLWLQRLLAVSCLGVGGREIFLDLRPSREAGALG
jgi:membrane-associated phospholipid phosphatase